MRGLKVLLRALGTVLGIGVLVVLAGGLAALLSTRSTPNESVLAPNPVKSTVTPPAPSEQSLAPQAKPTATPPSTLPLTLTLDSEPISLIAFEDVREGSPDIFVVQPDGVGLINLTRTPHIIEAQPQWSADGRHLYFLEVGKDGLFTSLYRINLDRTSTKLFNWEQDIGNPGVSPEGEWVAYTAIVGSVAVRPKCAIFKIRIDGTEIIQLTEEVGGENPPMAQCDAVPQWSPDGSRILFLSNRHTGGYGYYANLYTMNPDGTGVIQLTDFEGWTISYAAWAPDGQRIAFSAAPSLDVTGDLYVVDSDGSNLLQVTHTSEPNEYGFPAYDMFSWSPDGTRLACEGWSIKGVGILDLISGEQYALAGRTAHTRSPAWSPWLLPLEIVGSWSLDEGTGTIARDGSAYGYDGTLVGGPAWTTGHEGTALSFDGKDDYVLVADAPFLRVTDTLTLSAWVYRPAHASGRAQGLIARWTEGQRSYALYLQGQRAHFALSPNGSDVITLRSSSQIPKGQWVHLAAAYDGTSMGIYINGVLDAVQSGPATIFAGDAPLTLGMQNLGAQGRGDFFEGLLDGVEVRHWATKK
ncbi:MAG: LamG-like jellyroll fold domain-containing protein [Chloroflexia bacterium]